MFIPIQVKIRTGIFIIVLLFTFFTLFYFPKQEAGYLLKSYNSQVQNLANSVALGVRIALNEENFEGVKTAMEYVKDKPELLFVALLQADTVWGDTHQNFILKQSIFQTVPENVKPALDINSSDTAIVKRATFKASFMSGEILLAFSTREINMTKKSIRNTSILVSAGILFLGMLISFWLSRNISKPVAALSNAAQKVSKGDLTSVVEKYANDEVGKLAKAFNNMVHELYKTQHELKNANEDLSATNKILNTTLQNLKSTQAQLIQSEKMASLGEMTAGIAHEIQNPLNFVNNFSEVSNELLQEMLAEVEKENYEEVKSIVDNVKQNLEKINHHGKRADVIVKGMLQHTRKSEGKKEPGNINALCDEYLRLSYHGFRAKDKLFNAKFKTDFDESLPIINVLPQDIGRVILNLINNAFYAVCEKAKQDIPGYEPIVSVKTSKNLLSGDRGAGIEIRIIDNGNGIPDAIKEKIFHPFFTTKPTGQGTGLGLSLSYDIVKVHGGEIKVETKEGEGSEFIVQLPVA